MISIGLHHVSIPVPPGALDAGRTFYRDALGLPEITPPAVFGTERVVWFTLGNGELHLFVEPDANAVRSGRHLALVVEDQHALDVLEARVRAAGIEPEEAEVIPNRPRWYLHDPFGNRVECTTILGPYA